MNLQFSIFKFNFKFQTSNFKLVQALSVVVIILLFPSFVIATDFNNKFGIHLAQPSTEEFSKIKELVNSNGGDWGYVTLVIQENDRDKNKWQEVFNKLRENHLIPIIRLATQPEGENWRRPIIQDVDGWVNFLDSLNWVIKNRYIILFNEPNHGPEWGGEVDAKNYSEVVSIFAEKLKAKNNDYFIMLAGLDASAPSNFPFTEDEEIFLREVFSNQSAIINRLSSNINGISSHSYPNPGFAGSPYDTGRKSIRGYFWEIELFRQLTNQELPVFITETGWIRQCQMSNVKCQNEISVAENYKIAFEQVWGPDEKVKAVTPFVYDYQGQPFLDFSWKLPSAKASEEQGYFYSQYYTVQSLAKIKGAPEQIEKSELTFDFPKQLVVESNYHFTIDLKNTGQSILDKNDGYKLELEGLTGNEYLFSDLNMIEPFEETTINLYLKTNADIGQKVTKIIIKKGDRKIVESKNWGFRTLPLPQVNFSIGLYPKLKVNTNDFEAQIYNSVEELVYKKKGVKVVDGKGIIDKVKNIAIGKKYRIVILKPFYLPRQVISVINQRDNVISFRSMMPLDFSQDGKFGFEDFGALLKHPQLLRLLFP